MRKISVCFFLFFILAETVQAATIQYYMQYQSWRDEYRVDFTYPFGTASYRVWFIAPSDGQLYQQTYSGAPTGIYYLTCNGTYNFDFYDSSGQMIGYFRGLHTTQIQSPTCLSYPEQTGVSDFNIYAEPDPIFEGTSNVYWDEVYGTYHYFIYHDGVLIDETNGIGGRYPDGQITIIAKDHNGNIIARSDAFIPGGYTSSSPSTGTGTGDDHTGGAVDPPSDCDMCRKIAEALQCPEWNTYMGELTQAIRNALPTLPEWRQIAEQFVDAFAEYWGNVPSVPTENQIENAIRPNMPVLDTHVPGSDMEPILPTEFDTPFEFDVTDAPEIPVVDESEPFTIYEPDEFIDADDPGEFVFPGDPRNHSDGIKNPDIVQTGYDTPAPAGSGGSPSPVDPPIPEPPPDPNIPPSDMPEPAPTPPDMAIPTKSFIEPGE